MTMLELWIHSGKRRYYKFVIYSDLLGDRVLLRSWGSLDSDGYDVVNVIPISMGQTEDFDHGSKNKGSVGFSITRGAVVVGKKRNTKDDV